MTVKYPIQLVTDKQKIKEYHLKRLYELSLKSLEKVWRSEANV